MTSKRRSGRRRSRSRRSTAPTTPRATATRRPATVPTRTASRFSPVAVTTREPRSPDRPRMPTDPIPWVPRETTPDRDGLTWPGRALLEPEGNSAAVGSGGADRQPGRRSVRVTVDAEPVPERLDENLQIEAQAPALDVIEVALDPFLDRRVPPPPVDLGPPRDARLHLVAKHVAGHPASELLDEARALRARTHKTHLAPQHVEELRQLVEARAPQECAQAGAAQVVRAGPHEPGLRLGLHPHRAELQ